MIILDTHIWVWWIHNDSNLSGAHQQKIRENEISGIGICTISLWEVAKLVELGRLSLPCKLNHWFTEALRYPGTTLLELTPQIAVESTALPGKFHRDPADQIIVATSRVHDWSLITSDKKILEYPHVITAV